jgi:hypothetical protein
LAYGSTLAIGFPFRKYSPYINRLLETNLPDKKLRRVVFPDPDGPRIAVKVPGCIRPD